MSTSAARTDTSRERAILDHARGLLDGGEQRVEYIRRGFARQWGSGRLIYDPLQLRERIASVDEEPVTEVRWLFGPGPVARLEATFTLKSEAERVMRALPGDEIDPTARRFILGRLRDRETTASSRLQPETVIRVLAIHYLSHKGGGSLTLEDAKRAYVSAGLEPVFPDDGWRKQRDRTLATLERDFGPLP